MDNLNLKYQAALKQLQDQAKAEQDKLVKELQPILAKTRKDLNVPDDWLLDQATQSFVPPTKK